MTHHSRRNSFRAFTAALCLPAVSIALRADPASQGGPTFLLLAPYLVYGSSGPSDAMGDAQSAFPNGLLSLGGNPAHAGLLNRFETTVSGRLTNGPISQFSLQTGHPTPALGFMAVGLHYFRMNPGYWDHWLPPRRHDEWVFSLTAGRNIGSWLALGATLKAVSSDYCGTPVHGYYWDAGFLITKKNLSKTSRSGRGFVLGAALTNKEVVPIHNIRGLYRDSGAIFDAPTTLRIGASLIPAASDVRRLTLAFESVLFLFDNLLWDDYFAWSYLPTSSVNLGFEYKAPVSSLCHIIYRGGLRAAFLREERVPTFGMGFTGSLPDGTTLETGFSCMDERTVHARFGVYLRFIR